MKQDIPRAEINIAKIPGGGGVAGAIFAIGSTVIFLIGIPALWYTFPAAIALGCGVALVLHFVHQDPPGQSWIRSATTKQAVRPQPHR
ncbi:MAG: hypothetical protein QOJ99_631 [Bryobacterales bacterium]|jgi:hypothetical protein|nr:hypothetical protein [Bryobacterales bacterium]